MISSQYRDTDGDGYGDNLNGFEGDVCMNSNAEEVERDGFHDLIVLVAVMSTRMDIPIQQMIGLPIRKDLRMRSRTIHRSGTIPITMVLVTTWNTSMAKPGVLPIVAMVAKRPTDCPPSIVGAVPIPMRMVGGSNTLLACKSWWNR